MIENEKQHLTFEQIYDILINNYKDTLTEKITNIDEKIENLKINIETSVSSFARNRIDISAYIEDSDINLVQSNEVYTKMFDELKELSQKVKLIPETKGDSTISISSENFWFL
jgi:predicted  nucleic acid-binding Zn-ribbon protein